VDPADTADLGPAGLRGTGGRAPGPRKARHRRAEPPETAERPAAPPPPAGRPAEPDWQHETGKLTLGAYPPLVPGATTGWRPGRRLGIDVGTVRVGVALSDATGMLASPLETLPRSSDGADLDRLASLVTEHEVLEVVVGDPRHLSGASGASAQDAAAYARALAGRIGDVPVHLVDERLSTVTAASHLRAGGIDSREQRAVIDQAAAVVILQSHLDAGRRRS
jgi:putative Holliday junction resolvase